MKTKVIIFDLDGTLLPMEDQDVFVKTYFGLLAKKLAPHGYEPNEFINAVWQGTRAMLYNDGTKLNKYVFWDKFSEFYGDKAKADMIYFDEFYSNDFDNVKVSCGFNEKVKPCVDKIKDMGYRLVLATNPLFPAVATKKRIAWAGLKPEVFEYITTYENSSSCKPSIHYYQTVLDNIGAKPEECLMVGNDVKEDMVAEQLGMKVFLVTDNIINKEEKDISKYPQGTFDNLLKFIENLK